MNNNSDESDLIITDKSTEVKKNPNFDCNKRNTMLLRFFKKLFPKNDIRIMGDENSPAVVIDHEFILSCYVSNYKLRFTNKNYKGDILLELSLNNDFSKLTPQQIEQLNNWYTQSQHRKISRIYLESENTQANYDLLVKENFSQLMSATFASETPAYDLERFRQQIAMLSGKRGNNTNELFIFAVL